MLWLTIQLLRMRSSIKTPQPSLPHHPNNSLSQPSTQNLNPSHPLNSPPPNRAKPPFPAVARRNPLLHPGESAQPRQQQHPSHRLLLLLPPHLLPSLSPARRNVVCP